MTTNKITNKVTTFDLIIHSSSRGECNRRGNLNYFIGFGWLQNSYKIKLSKRCFNFSKKKPSAWKVCVVNPA